MGTRRRLSGEIKWENNVASPVWGNTFMGRREFRDSNSLFILYLEIAIKLSGTKPKFILQNASFWRVFGEILIWTSLISVLSWWTLGGECDRRKNICQIANLINTIRKSTWNHWNYKCGCKVLLNPVARRLQKGFGNVGKDPRQADPALELVDGVSVLLGFPLGRATLLPIQWSFFHLPMNALCALLWNTIVLPCSILSLLGCHWESSKLSYY